MALNVYPEESISGYNMRPEHLGGFTENNSAAGE